MDGLLNVDANVFHLLVFQGAWGGSLLMSRRHRWKLDGVERQVTVLCGLVPNGQILQANEHLI